MSNLNYPITVLEAERDNVPHQLGGLIAQLNKAIDILNEKKRKEGIKEREKLLEKYKKIKA